VNGAFFGRHKGYPLRERQTTLMESLLPRLAIDTASPAPAPLQSLFSPSIKDVDLEIGFGGGEHLAARAQEDSRIGLIGCEVFINGMAKALNAIDILGLQNIRLYHGDASIFVEWLPSSSIRRIYLLYPDPWPKRRHWKRRFVSDKRLKDFARILIPGGELRFSTDWADYAAWTLQHGLRSSDFDWTAEQADDWRKPWEGWSGTRYEAKALREERKPCYLTFRKRDRLAAV
jgi:tRNA (guanine-N7-)-methyltransferase